MSSIAIITARGGSKRIPRKNIKDFLGKPIIEYSIKAAIESKLFDEIMVSTDDEEIANISKKCGAKVPFMRSEETSNDYASTEDVLIEVLDCYEKLNKKFDIVCCIYPTAPFVTANKLVDAFNLMKLKNVESLVPVVKFSYPPQRGLIVKNDRLTFQSPENATARSQDLIPIYHDCGQFYMCKVDALRKYHDLITKDCIPFEIDECEVQDIDNFSDWKIAELKYKMMNGE